MARIKKAKKGEGKPNTIDMWIRSQGDYIELI